ncbi:MAG: 1-(5-phosphoribosyl)-5-[(5-phosphoribosylamino)methylideneamino]imidazole-4-carboxamide isomerase [Oscillospiraceae bacterium]|nr:1-(5-phosphoribosyl)-5-[(5-phosphoribosylamino)methylideneamino]imidazole-4-carboxamide isomerase [Oscillospiraceae bacterium]
MIIFPSIDLKDGAVVRLRKGDFASVHTVASDAAATAAEYKKAGAQWLHTVDLDGARGGVRKNAGIITALARESGLKVEMGGGVRSEKDVEDVFAMGVTRVVIGSAAVSDPGLVAWAAKSFPGRVAVGIDALDGTVRVSGWEKDSGLDYIDFAKKMEALGVSTLIFTDISRDGMLSGPSLGALKELSSAVSCDVVASGGVTTIDDVRALRDAGLYGAIIGKAYYAGTIDLAQAISEGGAPCSPNA